MDIESWVQGYLTGVSLHSHLRISQLFPVVVASMSVTGISSDFEWYSDLTGVEAITLITAEYVGEVTVSYSRDGRHYTNSTHIAELLTANPIALFHRNRRLWFRFHLADDAADLTTFTLWGVFNRDIPWRGDENAVRRTEFS